MLVSEESLDEPVTERSQLLPSEFGLRRSGEGSGVRVLPPSQRILRQGALLTLKSRVQTPRSLPTDAEGLGKHLLLGREDGWNNLLYRLSAFLPLISSANTHE